MRSSLRTLARFRMSTASNSPRPSPERHAELKEALDAIRAKVKEVMPADTSSPPTLIAVSKIKPASDITACYEEGHRDFGENYVNELVEKAQQLPQDIRWHFIGTLQSNKAKILASIPSLYCVQTLSSEKAATGLNKGLPESRTTPLNILLQINTSGEDSKSGLPPLTTASDAASSETMKLALQILNDCPRLHLQGLMTIGSLAESMDHDKPNQDFETLKQTRGALHEALMQAKTDGKFSNGRGWGGEDGQLMLSMGMSSDFEDALKAGSDIVRVGTGIFGARPKKEEAKVVDNLNSSS